MAQGVGSLEEVQSLYEASFKDQENIEKQLPLTNITTDLEEILNGIHQKQGYRWRLECLNRSLGSLRESDFGFIFARPETGKTTFLASETTGFLTQTERPIVWFNNEEVGSKVMLRIYQAFFGVTLEQLISNPKRFKDEFLERTKGLFHLFDSAQISRQDVEKVVNRINPGLVIYDQIDKIKGFNNDREDLRLGSIYQWARELAKNNHAAIGVCQADGTAEGVRYLTMEHVANAKTAKQAEADWILGIGKTHDDSDEYIRYFNISKNKLVGDVDSIPELRHGKFETILEPSIARYKDVISYD